MPPGFLSGLISAGGSLLSNLLGFGSQAATNKAQMQLAEYQYEKNLEMWNRQNEYNLPSNQRQRLLDAGLNPALMYGSGHVTNTAADAPTYDAPHLGAYTNFGDMGASGAVNAYLQANKQTAEIENIEEDTNVKKWNQQVMQVQRYQYLTDIAEAQLRIEHTKVEKKFWEEMARNSNARLKQEVENLAKQADYIDANTRSTNASASLTEENAETVRQSRPQILANLAKEGNLLDKQALAQIAAANASNAAAKASISAAYKYQSEARKTLEEMKFLTYRQQAQLDAHVNKMIYDSMAAGEEVTKAKLENWTKQYLISTGINPNASGIPGLIDKFAYGMVSLYKSTVNLFKGNGFDSGMGPSN